MTAELDVAVVGAGIAGLTAAHRLAAAGHRVEVFESEDAVGGRMASTRIDGWTIDRGAETLSPYGYPTTWGLIDELGLRPELHRVRHPVALWRDGRAHPWMGHPLGLLTGAGLSWADRVRMARMFLPGLRHGMAPDDPAGTPYGELTVAELGDRYGPGMVRDVLGPIATSAFGWWPERSAAAPMMSIFVRMRGSVRWLTYRGGQDTPARALAERLTVHTRTPVASVTRAGAGARVTLADGSARDARAVLVTVPAPRVRQLRPDLDGAVGAFVDACTFSSFLRVAVLLDAPLGPPGRPLYAALTATGTDPLLSGVAMEHHKCPDLAPAGKGLLSLLIAPDRIPELFDQPDDVVAKAAVEAGAAIVDGLAGAVVGTHVVRWEHAVPEATPAALRAWRAFAARPADPIDYAGDWTYLRPSSETAATSGTHAATRLDALLAG